MFIAARQVLLVENSGLCVNDRLYPRQVEVKFREPARSAEGLYGTPLMMP